MPTVNRFAPSTNRPRLSAGDAAFAGFRSRQSGTDLPDGIARYAENMRFDRGVAKVRAGTDAKSTDITLTNPPLVLDFTLADDVAVTSIERSGSTATVTTTSNHGYSSGNQVNISGAGESEYNGDFAITVTGNTTFTYTVSGTPSTPASGTIVANKGPRVYDTYSDRVRGSCTYATDDNSEGICIATTDTAYAYIGGASTAIAYPSGHSIAETDECSLVQFLGSVYLFRGRKVASAISISSLSQSSGTATCTTSGNHNLATNDWVDVRGASPNGYNGIVQITKTGDTTFTYAVDSGTASPATVTNATIMQVRPVLKWDRNNANDFTVVSGGPHASGGTLRKMPAADWGDHFMQLMVLPYDRDELILSDSLDADTFDTAYSQLRLEPDAADWLVAVHPYQDFQLLVFYRKSIHMVRLNDDLSLAEARTITRDIGCVSRKSIVTCGNRILWLSDQGVHSLNIGDLLSLRNDTRPLSDPINDQIDSINWAYAGRAVGVYHSNRYYLAVPLNSSSTNRHVLVFNFLNNEWESLDSYPGDFDVEAWHKVSVSGRQRLHATTTFGFVFLMEENSVDEYGNTSEITNNTITGKLYTRNYRIAGLDRARFHRLQITGDVDSTEAFSAVFRSTDPDNTQTAISYTATSNTDVSLRSTLRGRGQTGSVEITTTSGRPEIRTVAVEGTANDRQTVNTT